VPRTFLGHVGKLTWNHRPVMGSALTDHTGATWTAAGAQVETCKLLRGSAGLIYVDSLLTKS